MNESAEGSVRSLTPVYIYLCCPVMGLSSLSDDKVKLSAVFRVFPCPRPVLFACLQVIYIVFHNKKNPSTLYVFLVLKNILPIPNIFLVRKKIKRHVPSKLPA